MCMHFLKTSCGLNCKTSRMLCKSRWSVGELARVAEPGVMGLLFVLLRPFHRCCHRHAEAHQPHRQKCVFQSQDDRTSPILRAPQQRHPWSRNLHKRLRFVTTFAMNCNIDCYFCLFPIQTTRCDRILFLLCLAFICFRLSRCRRWSRTMHLPITLLWKSTAKLFYVLTYHNCINKIYVIGFVRPVIEQPCCSVSQLVFQL